MAEEYPTPSEAAADWLKETGDREAFDYKFGPAASESILGPEGDAPQQEQPSGGFLGNIVDGAKGVAQGVENAVNETVDASESLTQYGYDGINAVAGTDYQVDRQPDLDVVGSPTTMGGKLTEGIVQFAAGFVATRGMTGLKGLKGEMINGAIADALVFDPNEGNLSTMMEDMDLGIPLLTTALETDPEDPEWMNRFRNASEGLIIGGAFEAVSKLFRSASLSKKAAATGRGDLEEQAARELSEASEQLDQVDPASIREGEQLSFDLDSGDPTTPRSANDAMGEASEVASDITRGASESRAGSIVDAEKLTEWVNLREGVESIDLFDTPPTTAFNYSKMDGAMEGQQVIRVMEEALSESGALKAFKADTPETLATTAKAARRMAGEIGSIIGEGKGGEASILERLARDTTDLPRTLVAGKMALQSLGREVYRVADEFDLEMTAHGTVRPELQEKLVNLMETHANVQGQLKGIQTAAARATSAGRIRTADGIDPDAMEKLIRRGGSEQIAKLARRLKAANGGPNQTAAVIRQYRKHGFWDVVNEFWINSILSGYKTHVVNITSNVMQTAILPGERVFGGLIAGDKRQMMVGMREYAALRGSLMDSIRLAGRAFKEERNILDLATKIEGDQGATRAISGNSFGAKPGGKADNAINLMGKLLRLPGRALMAEDEFFKQLNFRSSLKANLMQEASEMTPEQLRAMGFGSKADFVESEFTKAFSNLEDAEIEWSKLVDLGRVTDDPKLKEEFINSTIGSFKAGNKTAERALRQARASTFTTPLHQNPHASSFRRGGETVQKAANRHPILRQIVPFIQTPTNILDTAMNRTPGLNALRGSYRRRFMSEDPAIRAEARGELATGVALTSAVMMLSHEGRLTGGGPVDPQQRATWYQDKSWQPYSVNIGSAEEPHWIEYRRMDPHGFLFGVIADMNEIMETQSDDPSQEANALLANVMLAVSNNLTSKTWLQGIADTVEVINAKDRPWVVQAWVEQKAASFAPYSSFGRQVNQVIDPYLRDTRLLSDKLKGQTPGLSDTVPARVSWLTGQKVNSPEHLLFAFKANSKEPDRVAEELRALDYGFAGPDRRIGNVDLSTEQYQRWNELTGRVELGGKILTEAIETVMQTNHYDLERQRVPDDATRPQESHRVQVISRIISQYKAAAKGILLDQDPELEAAVEKWERFSHKAEAGQPSGDAAEASTDFRGTLFENLGLQ